MSLTKLVFKNILDNGFRGILIILSVTIVGTLLYSSVNVAGVLSNSYLQNEFNVEGYSDVIISSKNSSDSPFFDNDSIVNMCKDEKDIEKYIFEIKVIGSNTNDKTEKYIIHGLDIQGFNLLTKSYIKDDGEFNGDKVIISQELANKYSLNINDNLPITINNEEFEFQIYDIKNSGVFFSEDISPFAVVIPTTTLRKIYNIDDKKSNRVSIIYSNYEVANEKIDNLKEKLEPYNVELTVDRGEAANRYRIYSAIFLITSVIASIMCIIIININFKILVINKRHFWSVIRGIGGSIPKCTSIIFLETIFYGIISGIISIIVGNIIRIQLNNNLINIHGNDNNSIVVFSILTVLYSTLISVLGALKPILKNRKNKIIRNDLWEITKNKKFKDIYNIILGSLLIGVSILIFSLIPRKYMIVATIISVMAIIIGMLILIPTVVKYIFFLLIKVSDKLSINECKLLALKNIENEYFYNIIKICSIGICVILSISMLGTSCREETKRAYKMFNSDGVIYLDEMNDHVVDEISKIEGVDDVYPVYEVWNVEGEGVDKNIELINSVDSNKHDKYFKYTSEESIDDILKKINQGKYIAISTVYSVESGKEKGDSIVLTLNNKEEKYEVVGIIDVIYNSGRYALIGKENMKNDTGLTAYQRVYFNCNGNVDNAINNIKSHFNRDDLWVISTKERVEKNIKSNEQIFEIIYVFILLASIVIIIGVINMLVINAIEGKKDIAIMTSIGMSRNFKNKYILLDGVLIGVLSITFGTIGALLIKQIIPFISISIGFPPMDAELNIKLVIISGIIFTIISSCIVMIIRNLTNKNKELLTYIKNNIN